MTKNPRIVDLSETEPNRRRGGDLRAMLTPATVGSTSGFMGLALVQPGERIGEHYHPYSEEFVYVVNGSLEVDLDGETHELRPDQGLLIPINMRHRFRNVGDVEARMVFHLGPLAPRPSLGHVDTEVTEGAEAGPGFITGGPDLTAPGHGQASERSGAIT
ncbi:cupin domain-containing protein [Streptomyces sp. NPDC055059]|jgi:putative monooxygenase|uniref:Cupin domain-containing protein n=1 Tax=Streptomyces sp. NBC_00119 TaxID=2975659 RepID=A0AAU1UFV9_9ACTN|nr:MULTISPECIES: cupin domain-containing protein [unclassified Streptomyces]MCX4647282.1 cupin domain-containing protein [Streptomyces sp. NBC_01446]MCX5319816.1 cupin domain-containing protein [Streptomyces sp. NBC_00120]